MGTEQEECITPLLCIEVNEVKQWRAAHGERLLISAVH